ncbi:hypothetical protein KP509_18G051400 [Ceratopteris richardii]|uniref:Uncharacterized protein n=1 Tax=Ceratopteris richardii TaxID=49495 RepID=A0A8T2STC7_CERRI|nr:hypothetical protein KP509_18G051400 [Ceratopteris richardii]
MCWEQVQKELLSVTVECGQCELTLSLTILQKLAMTGEVGGGHSSLALSLSLSLCLLIEIAHVTNRADTDEANLQQNRDERLLSLSLSFLNVQSSCNSFRFRERKFYAVASIIVFVLQVSAGLKKKRDVA